METEEEKDYCILMDMETARDFVNTVIAQRTAGTYFPMAEEDYAIAITQVELAEQYVAIHGGNIYEIVRDRFANGILFELPKCN